MSYTNDILEMAKKKNPGEAEFIQAVTGLLPALQPYLDEHPQYEQAGILERLIEPERQIIFRIPWVDDKGKTQVNRGFRVQYNSAIGPYKGGIRFHPGVTLSSIKFLSFEQTFKNSLTGLPIGGGKGGSDFDPKGKSDNEVMAFCQSFMNELFRHIDENTDVPAGDIGVGAREIGYMYGQYKRLVVKYVGVFTGKGLQYGGSLGRKEATGYGLVYMMENMLRDLGTDFKGKETLVSGSGNVAIYAAEKVQQLGGKVIAMSDSGGYVLDKDGIDLDAMKEIKEVKRGRIKEYLEYRPKAEYVDNGLIWSVPCNIALPCATENELLENGAEMLIKNGCMAVAEGSNMATSNEAIALLQNGGVYYAPGKAANAGGVAVSALEMTQNSMRLSWSFEEVDAKLKDIMSTIYKNSCKTAERYGDKRNLVMGASIAGFEKVAQAMLAQGVV